MAPALLVDFEDREEEVLRWLQRRRDVGEALYWDETGRGEAAAQAILSLAEELRSKTTAKRKAAKQAEKRPLPTAPLPSTEEEPPAKKLAGQEWLVHSRAALDAERRVAKAIGLERKRSAELASAKDDAPRAANAATQLGAPLYWQLEVPEVAEAVRQRGGLPNRLEPVADPHVTLLFLGGAPDAPAARRAEVDPKQFRANRLALEALDGKEVQVKLTRIVIEECVACAVVELPPGLPCLARVPHVTLGVRSGVPPKHSNDVLEDVAAGRTEGVMVVDLPPRLLKARVSLVRASPGTAQGEGSP